MSRYIDMNQLLDEMGGSSRSANDPWVLSRSPNVLNRSSSGSPGVAADIGSPIEELQEALNNSTLMQTAAALAKQASSAKAATSSGGARSSGWFDTLESFFPLASSIAKFFGFGGDDAPALSTSVYQAPPSISFEGGVSSLSERAGSLSYAADGMPRIVGAAPAKFTDKLISSTNDLVSDISGGFGRTNLPPYGTGSGQGLSSHSTVLPEVQSLIARSFEVEPAHDPVLSQATTGSLVRSEVAPAIAQASDVSQYPNDSMARSSVTSGQNILVQVQAMDTQSFMDHSHEIAQAVRQAMLNLNSLNDVILDL